MNKSLHFLASSIIGFILITLSFSVSGQQQGGPNAGIYENQIISTLNSGNDIPRFMLMAPPAANLDQYRNGSFSAPINTCTNWVNGNAGEQNSHYVEGWSIPYRCVMTDLPLNTSITLTLGYDIRNSGKNALDYLTYFHRMSPHDVFCDASHHSPECVTPAAGAFSTFAIPAPSSAGSPVAGMPTTSFNNLPASERVMRLYGGTITNIVYGTQGDLNANQSETTIKVTFTVTQANATLAWGGHIASRLDWGDGNSSSGISGSPYHMRLKSWTLNNLGNTDRSLNAGAVGPPCVVNGPDNVCEGSTHQYCVTNQSGITYNWTVSGGGATIVGSNTGNCVTVQAGDGNYSVMVSLASNNGFCSDCSMAVTVEPIGVCSIDGEDVICPGTSSHHCAPSGGTSYAWTISGAGTISGPADQECVTVIASNSCNTSHTLNLSVGGPNCGSTCTKTVLVKDDSPPSITCPVNVMLDCGASTLPANTGSATATDNCDLSPTITYTENSTPGSCSALTINRIWKAVDNCTNSNTCLQTITVNPAPQAAFVSLPANITIDCDQAPPAGSQLGYDNNEDGACDISGSVTGQISGSHDECSGSYSEAWSFTDDCGRTINHSRTITVNPAPQAAFVSLPANITIDCDQAPPSGSMLGYDNNEDGACDISGSVTGQISGSHDECGGSYSESWSFTDDCGRTINHSRTITVNPAPQAAFISLPANITIDCDQAPPSGTMLGYDNNEDGACDISGSVTGQISGSHDECGGSYSESWSFTDDCGRTINHSRTITVNPAPQAAFVSLPANITIDCDQAPPSGTMLGYDNNENGACDISGSVTGQISGSHDECGGSYSESWSFTDDCGRTINHSRTITVNPAPQAAFVSLPANITIDCDQAPPSGTMLGYDNNENGACDISGSVTGQISGSHDECGGSYSESWSFTDDCGRTINHSRTITVNPAPQAAFVSLPANITIDCDQAPPSGSMLGYDNNEDGACDISGSATGQISGSHDECGGSYSESWSYTDDCGRTINHSRTIYVNPTPQAAFVSLPANITIDCDQAPPSGSMLGYDNNEDGACDISGSVTGQISGSHDECGGSYSEAWSFTDECGRTINHSRTIYVNPAPQAAFISLPANITIDCDQAPPSGSQLGYDNNEDGACDISGSVTGQISGSHDECGGSYSEAWSHTDDCGRTINHSRTIYVNPAPQAAFVSLPANITIDCDQAPPSGTMLGYDNNEDGACDISGSVTGQISGSHDECGGSYSEAWSHTDDCGRTINHSRTIYVNPAPQAAFVSLPANITIDCDQAPPSGTMLGYDNNEDGACDISGSVTGQISGSHDECGGSYSETWSFTDNCGRTINHSRTIYVNPAPQAAFISLPANITIDCDKAPPSGSQLGYDNNEDGACDISGSVTGQISGSQDECGGSYSEAWSFTDDCGRTINHSRTITVNPAPQAAFVSLPANITIDCDQAPPSGTMLGYDNNEDGACDISGSVTGQISGSHDECGGSYSEAWSYTDDCGRTINHSRTITVNPAPQAAFVSLPANITIDCDQAPPSGSQLGYDNNEDGACDISGSVTGQISGSHDECGGSYSESWFFTDDCGRTINHSRTITVNPAPQAAFVSLPANITIDCDQAPPSGSMLGYDNNEDGACDISGSVTGQISGSHDECGGAYFESWSFTDDCGRTILHFRFITVNPAPAPAFVSLPGDITISCVEVPPSPTSLDYTNGETGDCEISGSLMSEITGDFAACGGSYKETWLLNDPCPDRPAIEHSRSITVIDDTPPSGLCPPDVTVYCLDNIPCPDGSDLELAGMMDIIETSYLDACSGGISVAYLNASELQECADPDGDGNYTFGRTFYFEISDACGNTTNCDISYTGSCQPFCTFTQGFWGNAKGKANGLTTKQILDILMPLGGISIGDGNNCGFTVMTTTCILNIMPAGGPSVPLGQNYNLNCSKKLKNTLVGQLIALNLNLRYNQHFNGFDMGSVVLSQSCVLTSSQISSLGLNSTSTVADLIKLANKFLASNCNGINYPNGFGGQLTNALAALNEYWDECHVADACEMESKTAERFYAEVDSEDLTAFSEVLLSPNPASSMLGVGFNAEKSSTIHLNIFNAHGQLIRTEDIQSVEGSNNYEIDLSSYKSGIYWLNMANDETSVTKRFIVMKE